MKLGGGVGDNASAPIASLPIAPALATLFEAFRHSAVVTFAYRGDTRTLEPWGLSSKRGHWYVVGFDRDRGAVRAFRADRIEGDVEIGVAERVRSPGRLPRRRPHRGPRVDARRRAAGHGAARGRRRSPRRRARRARRRGTRRHRASTAAGDTVVEVTVTNRAAFRSFVLGFLEHAEIVEPPDVRAAMIEWLEAGRGRRIARPR